MAVLDWLLDSDPSIRWQALRDLTGAPVETVAAERTRVATDGRGARLLALRGEDGQWAGGAYFPGHLTGPAGGTLCAPCGSSTGPTARRADGGAAPRTTRYGSASGERLQPGDHLPERRRGVDLDGGGGP
ncbi:hypothetical protein GCM10027605_39490 [Micromonospora zhanjiangensis]